MSFSVFKKLNIVISFWLASIISILLVMGYELSSYGFYIAGAVFALLLIIINISFIISGLIINSKKSPNRKRQFNNF